MVLHLGMLVLDFLTRLEKNVSGFFECFIDRRKFIACFVYEIDNRFVVFLVVAVSFQLLIHLRGDILLSSKPTSSNPGCYSGSSSSWRPGALLRPLVLV